MEVIMTPNTDDVYHIADDIAWSCVQRLAWLASCAFQIRVQGLVNSF
jgi:hypothetical protein